MDGSKQPQQQSYANAGKGDTADRHAYCYLHFLEVPDMIACSTVSKAWKLIQERMLGHWANDKEETEVRIGNVRRTSWKINGVVYEVVETEELRGM